MFRSSPILFLPPPTAAYHGRIMDHAHKTSLSSILCNSADSARHLWMYVLDMCGTQFVEARHGNANTLKADGEIEARGVGGEKKETKLRRFCGRTSAVACCGGEGAEPTPALQQGGSVPAVDAARRSRLAAGRRGGCASSSSPSWSARHSPGRSLRTAGDAAFRVWWRAEDNVVECLTCPRREHGRRTAGEEAICRKRPRPV